MLEIRLAKHIISKQESWARLDSHPSQVEPGVKLNSKCTHVAPSIVATLVSAILLYILDDIVSRIGQGLVDTLWISSNDWNTSSSSGKAPLRKRTQRWLLIITFMTNRVSTWREAEPLSKGLITWTGLARLAELLRCAEMTFSRYYMRRASPVDGWCDEPWETGASLILNSHWRNEQGWPGKSDYMEKSQPG